MSGASPVVCLGWNRLHLAMSIAAKMTLQNRPTIASEMLQEQLIASISGKENAPASDLVRLGITRKHKQWTSLKL